MYAHTSESVVAGTTVLAIDGPVDLATVGTVRDALLASVRRHPGTTIAVDLDAVTVLDDTGLGILLGAAAVAREAGGDLVVVCSDANRRARFARTGLDRALTVREAIG
jgi:anti-sigma B factor antagonist